MKKVKFVFIILSAWAVFLAACMPTQLEGEIPPTGQEVVTSSELVGSLEDDGRDVSVIGDVNQPFIPVTGQLMQVNGQEVQVFEFSTQQERQQISDLLRREGFTIEGIAPGVQDPYIWDQGRLLVIYVGQDQETINTLNNFLGESMPFDREPPPVQVPQVQPAAVLEAASALAAQVGVPVQQVEIIDFNFGEWPDSCLGAAEPDEACLQVITPGYQVILQVNGQRYEVRTDETGSNVRFVN
jgi:hypothetical protein